MSCINTELRPEALMIHMDFDNETLLNLLYQRVLFVDNINNINETVIIGDGAVLTGDVRVGSNTVIFNNTMLQADKAPITIGKGCCIVDGVLMHNRVEIADFVHIAHGCIIHRRRTSGCLSIGSGTLVGFGSQVHDNIGIGCQIAPGVIVDQPIPDYHFVYDKKLGSGFRKTIVSPMRAANCERVVQMYQSFWGRQIIIRGKLVPLIWKHRGDGKTNGILTFDGAVLKLKSYLNHRKNP